MGGETLPERGLKMVASQNAAEVELCVEDIIVSESPRQTMESLLKYLYPDKDIDMDKLY